ELVDGDAKVDHAVTKGPHHDVEVNFSVFRAPDPERGVALAVYGTYGHQEDAPVADLPDAAEVFADVERDLRFGAVALEFLGFRDVFVHTTSSDHPLPRASMSRGDGCPRAS